MRLRSAIVGTVAFFFIAPGIVAGVVPIAIAGPTLPDTIGLANVAGGLLIAAGLIVLITAFARFAIDGRGTPAPPAPTETLVVSGLYRHVRNPMYVAVIAIILGQALFFASVGVAVYAAVVFAAVHGFVVAYEEPTLSDAYGAQYEAYRRGVPRWIPRPTPWRPKP